MAKTIKDFFNVQLDNISDDTFVEGNPETNTSGQSITNFRKSLRYLECNLFDTVEIKQFEGNIKNIFFKNYELDNISIADVQNLLTIYLWFMDLMTTIKESLILKTKKIFYR